jgi:hypothetical protein
MRMMAGMKLKMLGGAKSGIDRRRVRLTRVTGTVL